VTLYAMDSKATLWLLDTKGNGGAGSWTQFTMSGAARSFPHGIDLDAEGNLYVANSGTYGNPAISKITISGTNAVVANFPTGFNLNAPWDVTVDGNYLYIQTS